MDSIKEIFDALGQRIKSPVFGYVAFAFVFCNWKPLYYLFFSGKPALMKFNFFEANTDNWTLYIWPVIIGVLATLTAPWISYFGSWWSTKPTNAKRLREVESAHAVLSQKNKYAQERDNERSIFEKRLIDQAKRDDQVEEIKDATIRQNLERELENARSKNASNRKLSDREMKLLSEINRELSGINDSDFSNNREAVSRVKEVLKSLLGTGI